MIMEVISILLGVVLLVMTGDGGLAGGFGLDHFRFLLDMPSFVILLVFTVPVLFRNGVWRDFKRAFRLLQKNYACHLSELRRTLDVVEMMQKQVIYAGIVCMLLSFISILGILSDPASLGPMMAVAILTVLYAVIFEMLLLPLQLEVKRRIIDYMEEDTEPEGSMADDTPAGNGNGADGVPAENGNGTDGVPAEDGGGTASGDGDGRI